MFTFIDEWRRKFPSCMVVKRLSTDFVPNTSDLIGDKKRIEND